MAAVPPGDGVVLGGEGEGGYALLGSPQVMVRVLQYAGHADDSVLPREA